MTAREFNPNYSVLDPERSSIYLQLLLSSIYARTNPGWYKQVGVELDTRLQGLSLYDLIFPNVRPDVRATLETPAAFFVDQIDAHNRQNIKDEEIEVFLVESAAFRYLDLENTAIEDVRQRLAQINATYKLHSDTVWGDNGVGGAACNDADLRARLKVKGDIKTMDFETKRKITDLFFDSFRDFYDTVFESVGGMPEKEKIKDGNRTHDMCLNDDMNATTNTGSPATNPDVLYCTSGINHLTNGRYAPLMHTDFGCIADPNEDKRHGYLVSRKSNIFLKLKADGDRLIIDETEESLRTKRALLYAPDEFEANGTNPDITKDLECIVRALRHNFFCHTETGEANEDLLGRLFTNRGWDKIIHVVNKILDKPDVLSSMSQKQKDAITSEMIVLMEKDPYLFLMMAQRTNLLRIFPVFRNVSADFWQALLTSDAMTFPQNGDINIDPEKRNIHTILRSRQEWKKSGYYGTKLIANALRNERRKTCKKLEDYLPTKDEVEYLFVGQDDVQVGAFSFLGRNSFDFELSRKSYYTESFRLLANAAVRYQVELLTRDTVDDNFMNAILNLYQISLDQTNFDFAEICKTWKITNPKTIQDLFNQFIRRGLLVHIAKKAQYACKPTAQLGYIFNCIDVVEHIKKGVKKNKAEFDLKREDFQRTVRVRIPANVVLSERELEQTQSQSVIIHDEILDRITAMLYDSGLMTPLIPENHKCVITPATILDAISSQDWTSFDEVLNHFDPIQIRDYYDIAELIQFFNYYFHDLLFKDLRDGIITDITYLELSYTKIFFSQNYIKSLRKLYLHPRAIFYHPPTYDMIFQWYNENKRKLRAPKKEN